LDSKNDKIEQLNEVDRFILLLLRAKQSKAIPGAIWLQKEMFLLQNVFPSLADETDFEPYFLGPHSEIVADEAQELEKSKLVKTDGGRIVLTPQGKEIADTLAKKSNDKEVNKIEEFKEFLNDLSKDELLAFVYFSYPMPEEIAKESVEFRSLLPKRKKLALSLYEKGKISAQKAAQIAGMNLEDFMRELKMVA
jgi:predicted HTH domain antitoxin